ncbi:MAG: hypothetical protein IPK83_00890 [Planctomycetes bacterium]|nr:hypothetical protein [Planctomycetota bacterium]
MSFHRFCEAVFLGKPGLDPRGCQRDDILNVALGADCELCLIYARVEETDADAEYAGILWNTRTRTAMATVRTPVILPIQVAAELKEDPNCDRAIAEADFRSEQDFRRMVRDLMWDIASHDVAYAGKDTNPWKNYVPPMPPMYDRYRFPNSKNRCHTTRPASNGGRKRARHRPMMKPCRQRLTTP